MPRRDLLDDLLTAREKNVIAAVSEAANVPLSRWHGSTNLARPFLLLAWSRLARRVHADEGISLTAARQSAAIRLGLELETLRSWQKRWRRDAYQAGSNKRCAPHPGPERSRC